MDAHVFKQVKISLLSPPPIFFFFPLLSSPFPLAGEVIHAGFLPVFSCFQAGYSCLHLFSSFFPYFLLSTPLFLLPKGLNQDICLYFHVFMIKDVIPASFNSCLPFFCPFLPLFSLPERKLAREKQGTRVSHRCAGFQEFLPFFPLFLFFALFSLMREKMTTAPPYCAFFHSPVQINFPPPFPFPLRLMRIDKIQTHGSYILYKHCVPSLYH